MGGSNVAPRVLVGGGLSGRLGRLAGTVSKLSAQFNLKEGLGAFQRSRQWTEFRNSVQPSVHYLTHLAGSGGLAISPSPKMIFRGLIIRLDPGTGPPHPSPSKGPL